MKAHSASNLLNSPKYLYPAAIHLKTLISQPNFKLRLETNGKWRLYLTNILISLTVFLYSITTKAAFVQPHELDWNRAISESGIHFIPLKEQKSGILLYDQYDRALIGPNFAFSPYERVVRIRVLPKAYNTNAYHQFINHHHLKDIRRNLDMQRINFPQLQDISSLCKPTTGLLDFIKSMSFMPKLRIDPGNYPGLCSLEIKYLVPEKSQDEARLLTYISSNPVIEVNVALPQMPSVDIHQQL
jgi:hypothetical protein